MRPNENKLYLYNFTLKILLNSKPRSVTPLDEYPRFLVGIHQFGYNIEIMLKSNVLGPNFDASTYSRKSDEKNLADSLHLVTQRCIILANVIQDTMRQCKEHTHSGLFANMLHVYIGQRGKSAFNVLFVLEFCKR